MTSDKRQKPRFVPPLAPCNVPIRRCGVPRDEASKRILIMRLAGYGDIVMASPLLTALRQSMPDAHITWAAEATESDAVIASPIVDEVLLWDTMFWKRMKRRLRYDLWLYHYLKFKREIEARNFDIFISFQPEEWGWLAQATRASVKIGVFDTFRQFYGTSATSRNTRLYDHAFTVDDLPAHRTDQYLLPLRPLGIPRPSPQMQIGFTVDDRAAVDAFLAGRLKNVRRIAVIAPMTTWPSRCWPADRFAELCDRLPDDFGVVLIGSKSESDQIEKVAAGTHRPVVKACGVFDFRQAAAMIARADVLVSGDTGPMHVAAAVGTPYVALFGPTPVPGRAPLAGPGRVLVHPVPCGPCDKKICPLSGADHMQCMRLITVDETVDAVLDLSTESSAAQ